MALQNIVQSYLREHGFDGLYCDDCDEPCGCDATDLAPCGDLCAGATPAYKHKDGRFYPTKEAKDE